MAKDPAFLFYYQDFLVGTSFMTLEETGAYIKILCFQADRGPLLEKDILKKIPLPIWTSICCKFKNDKGMFFNARLAREVEKRRAYTLSRHKNLHMDNHMGTHMGSHMPPHMEDENEDVNRDSIYRSEFEAAWKKYPSRIGKKAAERHFIASVKTEGDCKDIQKALQNYLLSERVTKGYVQNGSTWFNNWRDWIVKPETKVNPNRRGTTAKDLIKKYKK